MIESIVDHIGNFVFSHAEVFVYDRCRSRKQKLDRQACLDVYTDACTVLYMGVCVREDKEVQI